MDLKRTALTTLKLIDLTSLNDNDTPGVILNLCKQAKTPFGHVPAVCIIDNLFRWLKIILLPIN